MKTPEELFLEIEEIRSWWHRVGRDSESHIIVELAKDAVERIRIIDPHNGLGLLPKHRM